MSLATPEDVRNIIDTDLSDSEIQGYLDMAAAEIDLLDEEMSDSRRQLLEARYAAYLIVALRDREKTSLSQESASVSWESSVLDTLQMLVDQIDPSGELVGITRDSDRYVTSTADS